MARELEVDPEDVAELLRSHDQPLSDEDLLLLEEQRRIFQEEESHPDDNSDVPREMTTKELQEYINHIEIGIAGYERIDPNFDRSSKVNATLINGIACYKEILRERKRYSMSQSSLLSYFKKIPAPSSTAEISTSSATPTPARASELSPKQIRFVEESDDEDVPSPSSFLL
ncbi:tigger transposable element-derived protein 1-like [Zootermopsis nevadensis]|uniref:tigger transposable element-derived protein 1-like n=1 Tax=Zootermopsis nevadensis TaxID=136037 RepID=UPI000B8EC9C3|nr:tigger transposable element-derived protein 1-like [Zootermopsis nevadensis]